jgi:hypothetical protein
MKKIMILWLFPFLICTTAIAEEPDELIVSAVRAENTKIPGTSLKRPADYVVQRLRVSSESKEEKTRKEEIFDTLRLLANVAKEKNLEPCSIVDNRFVIPLKIDSATLKIVRGNRTDTSEVTICIKSKVTPGTGNAIALYSKLKDFPTAVKPVGRTAIDLQGEVEITIINPGQYREAVIKLFAADAKLVTASLAADYRVVTRGIDHQLQWMRDGMTDVVLFIPYEYDVVPPSRTAN